MRRPELRSDVRKTEVGDGSSMLGSGGRGALLLLFVLMMLGRSSAGSRGPLTDGLTIIQTKLTLGEFRFGVCKMRSRRGWQ